MNTTIKIWFTFTLLWAGLMACQKSDVAETPQTSLPSPIESAVEATPQPLPTTTKTTSVKQNSQKATPGERQVAVTQNSASNQRSCKIGAYIVDKDPKGLNVRSQPNSQSKIVDTLPTNNLALIVDVDAAQGDWVQLSKAQSPGKLEFQGSGWVYAPLLGTSTRGYGTNGVSVYESANNQVKVIGRIPSQRNVKLLSCDRAWALVEYQGLKGWLEPESQCANPLTTCP
ncbi:MAG: SH3 domain-containing protein [Coleofasciculaceae cyanobacterium]